MDIRFVLVLYRTPDGGESVGSGMLVTEHAVLTADHVADGTEHRVLLFDPDRREVPVKSAVRSGSTEVDLAALLLSEPVRGVEPMVYARVNRGANDKITKCWAVGFPRRGKDKRGRASLTLEGHIRPADGLHPGAGGTVDDEWLTLVGEDARWEPVPANGPPSTADNPWGGMSGAVVLRGGMVIGVIRSHNPAKGPSSLAVTPLTALKRLPERKRQQMCAALGIADIDGLTVIRGDEAQPQAVSVQPPARSSAFSPQARERYRDKLAQAGLAVPELWDAAALDQLRQAHQARDATAELLEALCMAVRALPLLERFGGHQISSRKLQYLYRRHVGQWPRGGTREEMVVDAASASVSERRPAAADSGCQPERPTALARFMLGIAGHWKAPDAPDDPALHELADWLTGTLMEQWDDASRYLAEEVGNRTWALIEVSATENSRERTRADAIVLDLVSEHGRIATYRIPCASGPDIAPEEAVLRALREAVEVLPADGEVLVDLCLPRHWLDAGVEDWEVVRAGGIYESLSDCYKVRLRWSMHRNDPRLRARLVRRYRAVDWSSAPQAIPAEVTSDPAGFREWLRDRDPEGTVHPPYFAGASPADHAHDPLGLLLRDGYGFAVWFPAPTVNPEGAAACAQAAQFGAGVKLAHERLNDLPGLLAAKFRRHRPVIVWSNPDGREDFPLPAARGGGTLRGGCR